MNDADDDLIKDYSAGKATAMEVRTRLDLSYADVLIALAARELPLPKAPTIGREADLDRARAWMFPKHAA